MNLEELAAKSGIPGRTIRFYISRGVLEGPNRAGRGAEYGPKHLERLERIRALQSEGRTLAEISLALGAGAAETVLPEATAWWQYAVADDVVVMVKAQTGPWRTRAIQRAVEEFARRLTRKDSE